MRWSYLPPRNRRSRRIEKEYVARERLAHFGRKPRQKILLYGAPGCGKSMCAERIDMVDRTAIYKSQI